MDNAALFAKVFISTYISVFQLLFFSFQKPYILFYMALLLRTIFNKTFNYCSFLLCII